jgi:hypothetical protein
MRIFPKILVFALGLVLLEGAMAQTAPSGSETVPNPANAAGPGPSFTR